MERKPQLIDVMVLCGLTRSRGEGRRLITQGGVLLNGEKVADEFRALEEADFVNGEAMIKKAKGVSQGSDPRISMGKPHVCSCGGSRKRACD